METYLEVLKGFKEYIDLVIEQVTRNTDTLLELEKFSQILAAYIMDITKIIQGIGDSVKGVAYELTDRLDILELSQDALMEVVNNLSGLVKLSMINGILNTAVIVAIITYLIFNRRNK